HHQCHKALFLGRERVGRGCGVTVDLTKLRSVHLVGIGGMHMSAIARILLARGHAVSGSDTTMSDLTVALSRLGATVHIGPHTADNVPAVCDVLVHTSAVNDTNPEVAEAIARGLPHLERAQMVAV